MPRHPLTVLVNDLGATAVAAKLGVHRASVYPYYRRSMDDRDLLVPAPWVQPLVELSGIEAHFWRPDVFIEKV